MPAWPPTGAFRKPLKSFFPTANGLVSGAPSGVVDFINASFAKFGKESSQQQLPKFPTTMPVGMTIKADATGMVKQFYIPEDVVKAVGSYKTMLQEASQKTGQSGYDQPESEMQKMPAADQ